MVIPASFTPGVVGESDGHRASASARRPDTVATYVGDVVDGVYALVREPRAVGQVFNIGNAEEITVIALAERMKAITQERVGHRR